MTESDLLTELREVANRLGIGIQDQAGRFSGGICVLKGRRVLLLNPALTANKAIEVLCRELASQDLSRIFILPAVRDLIENGRKPQLKRR